MRLNLKTLNNTALVRHVALEIDGRCCGTLYLLAHDADEFLRLLLARGVQLSTVEHDGWMLPEDTAATPQRAEII